MKIFNTETNETQTIKFPLNFELGRRAHAAAIVGKYLLIHGGIDSKGMYLKNIYLFDLSNSFTILYRL